tara:strand:+ start:220 stop:936 length:717 start_codon:yes stop_codon:yes gene_type:complete
MIIFNFIKKKYIRLQGSRNILKLNYFIEKKFRDKKLGDIGFNFLNKPNRQFIVQEIINIKKYKSYLEIGTFHDELFEQIRCDKKVGVDPVSGGTVRKTSDQFFKDNKDTFDCIFIDGLHYYSQVKKDIQNSLKILNHNGIILLHDCLPNNHFAQAVPRCQMTWNGDVWKAIVECRSQEDIDTYTCYADFGIGVIFKRKNRNILKIDRKEFFKLKFDEYFYKHKEFMNIIEYEDLKKII